MRLSSGGRRAALAPEDKGPPPAAANTDAGRGPRAVLGGETPELYALETRAESMLDCCLLLYPPFLLHRDSVLQCTCVLGKEASCIYEK